MSPLKLSATQAGQLDVQQADGRPLFRYVYRPDTPANESRRPYFHPLYSIDGDVLTNFRPNDHPWHHALSLTLASVNGVNFWGGPSYRAGEGYQWRDDHGEQVHVEWVHQAPDHLQHVIEWRGGEGSRPLLQERRSLRVSLLEDGWSLRWTSLCLNVSGGPLRCDNYHSGGGLEGSHYTGLQFRGARGLLDDHGDKTIEIFGDGGPAGEANLQGRLGRWIEWRTQHDGSLRRTNVKFETLEDPIPWFLRRYLPLVGFALHREQPLALAANETLTIDHRLTFRRA